MANNKQYFITDVETDELVEVSKERFDEYLKLIGQFYKIEKYSTGRDPFYDLYKQSYS